MTIRQWLIKGARWFVVLWGGSVTVLIFGAIVLFLVFVFAPHLPFPSAGRDRLKDVCDRYRVGSKVGALLLEMKNAGAGTVYVGEEGKDGREAQFLTGDGDTPEKWSAFLTSAEKISKGHAVGYVSFHLRMIARCTIGFDGLTVTSSSFEISD